MSEELVKRISEESGQDEEEVKEEIEEKMEEFAGMVSEEGAVHLVAKDHGIEIEKKSQDLKVENVVSDMRKVEIKARVTNILDVNTFERDGEEGRVQNIVLADETESIRMSLWDDQVEIAEKVEVGDAIHVTGAYTVEDNQGNPELRLGDSAQVKMADEGEVPEVEASGGGGEAEEVDIREVTEENANYTVEGMIMDVYTSNPFYRVDPETGDTVRENEDGELVTDSGKEVEEPDHRLAVSAVVDDGTENIRAVFFRERARELLDLTEEEEREGDQEAVEKAVPDARGKEVRVTGRARMNDYFGRLELIVNEMSEVDPGEKLEELLEVMEA
jgi:ssDNA-binding replication factor A large subunit